MIFYARKIFRKQTGNFTFVVVTDRDDLDGQIYRNFLHTGTVTKAEAAQPKDSEEMRKFLGQNKRLVFTLIQKFRWPTRARPYPLLSPRNDIIVIVDEAHRTQYKDLAENMRAGLKNAQYLAFTGTPLLGRERKTNQWFGDYVSEYNFQQSMDDGATVPLFYEKRVPQVLIQNDDLSEEFYRDSGGRESRRRAAGETGEQVRAGDRSHQTRRPAGDDRQGHRLSLPAARLSRQRHGGLAGQVHRREDVRQGPAALEGTDQRTARADQEIKERNRERSDCRSSWTTCARWRWR